jgi:hypothetical protein
MKRSKMSWRWRRRMRMRRRIRMRMMASILRQFAWKRL